MLSIVATPIGNLQDISLRQAEAILSADFVLAEDTRKTGILIAKTEESFEHLRNHKQKIISFYKEVEFKKVPEILDWISNDYTVCLVSDAGMPGISDPGYLLIQQVIKRELSYTVIPGPTAVTTALMHSGFNPGAFMFIGFLPKKSNQVKKELEKWKKIKEINKDLVFIFFEAPHRINETLSIISELLPDSKIAVCRELTKLHEQIHRGTAVELKDLAYRGEITVVLQ